MSNPVSVGDDLVEREPGRCWPLGGYAPGNYSCQCVSCGKLHVADKRASQCLVCAVSDAHARATTAEAQLKAAREETETLRGHVEQLACLLEIIKDDWPDYDHVYSISVFDARAALNPKAPS